MNAKPSLHQSDTRPFIFPLAVIIGGIGSAVLSGLRVHPIVSVIFALFIMCVLAFLWWRMASEVRDFQSLEAFAEDIYLLGYLLTLAALLGVAPRLMSDETNLFHIAGLKLATTVVGLALMMIFRQVARRWAEEKEGEDAERFVQQQQLFSEAVGRLNRGADELTGKLADVISRFDPDMLTPVADWSNRAVAAFAGAIKALENVPSSLEAGRRNVDALSDDLVRAKSAAGELAGVLSAGTAQAANALTVELGRAKDATGQFGAAAAALQPAGEIARQAIQKLGTQAEADAARLGDVGERFEGTLEELKKAEGTLKKLLDLHAVDTETPLNRLVQALNTSATQTAATADRFDKIHDNLREIIAAMQTLTLEVQTQATGSKPDPTANQQLLTRLGELREEMGKTNAQLKALGARFDASAGPDNKPRSFRWFRGAR